jgi:magnesium-transporting ATPase (P-type)
MDATTYVPVGNPTEVGLLKFLQDADIPVHLLIQQKLGRIKTLSPFSSFKKRSAQLFRTPIDQVLLLYILRVLQKLSLICARAFRVLMVLCNLVQILLRKSEKKLMLWLQNH